MKKHEIQAKKISNADCDFFRLGIEKIIRKGEKDDYFRKLAEKNLSSPKQS